MWLLRRWTRRVSGTSRLLPLINTRRCVPELLLCLTFQHSPSAESIQGASFFFRLILRFIFRLKAAAFDAYVDRELPNIRADVRGPSPLSAGSVLTTAIFTESRATLAAVQGAAHHFTQFAITGADFRLSIGVAHQAIPKVA